MGWPLPFAKRENLTGRRIHDHPVRPFRFPIRVSDNHENLTPRGDRHPIECPSVHSLDRLSGDRVVHGRFMRRGTRRSQAERVQHRRLDIPAERHIPQTWFLENGTVALGSPREFFGAQQMLAQGRQPLR